MSAIDAVIAAIKAFDFEDYGLHEVDPTSEYAEWVPVLAAAVHAAARPEVLAEAAAVADRFTERWPDMDAMKAAGIIGPFTAFGRLADELREMAGKDTGGQPAGESTQPAPSLALPWAAAMDDSDLHQFLGDLVSAAIGRWQSDPDVPDRDVLAAVEEACANWRTPGQGLRSDEADFFQPGRVYERRRWSFHCLAVAPSPTTGLICALGYLTRTDGTCTAHALDQDDWEHQGWTETTEGGVRTTAHAPSAPGTCARARGTYDWVNGTTPERETPCRPYPELHCVASCRITEGGDAR